MVSIGLVYSIHGSTEVAIQKMIDAGQRMIAVNSQVEGEAKEGWGYSGNALTKNICQLRAQLHKLNSEL